MEKVGCTDNFRKRIPRLIVGLFILISLCGYMSLHVSAEEAAGAQEANIQGTLMAAAEDTAGRERPEKNAASVVELPAGTHLLVVGEETDGWYEIYYQGKMAYVPAADLTVSEAVDAAALEKEMQKIGEEDSAFIESLEMQRKALARSKVWRTIIVVLIAAVFATGVVSALRKPKDDEKHANMKKNTGKTR